MTWPLHLSTLLITWNHTDQMSFVEIEKKKNASEINEKDNFLVCTAGGY